MHHDIDLSSHSEGDRFAFYSEPARAEGRAFSSLNERRLGDHLQLLGARGFTVAVKRRTMEEPSTVRRNGLAERFRRYSDEDLLCSRVVVVARKAT